ncbi:structural maintenance of chromosomes protein 4 [Aplysia californica]|uniref:Structural maintenance of chromosomes protein n=1 Tax=Aplysia californica TaxID=6500 RepID=A0ABM0JLC4_APLCA|nr:structural maintenance of chromosomes protein 4 [Aplysia californica]
MAPKHNHNGDNENMEVDGEEIGDTETSEAVNPPVVFNPADYGPIEIPDAVQSVATYEPNGPRLMITQIVNENFKSYAGIQKLGPFNKNFTAIIGPNGSGKSNVIDSMLFVFGYRANKIRSKKISVLIHNSEKHQEVNSCSVAVHFQKIVDTGPGDEEFTVVPDSQFVVSRVAHRDNSSSYYVDGKKAAYKEVATLLRGCGIDLDHNRFLILQGEVEQIAMMKPKAQTEHEDGMLEFLEDIIGSNRFKQPIETLSQRVETLNDLRAEKLNRVKAVEKEMESLEGPKNEAVEFLTMENELMKLRNKLYQKYILECSENEAKAQAEFDRVQESHKAFAEKLAVVKEAKTTKMKEFNKVKKEYEKLVKASEESREKFSDMESQDAACQEEVKLNKAKLKKLEKSLEVETAKIEELKLVPEQSEKMCEELKKKLANLEKAKQKEEENEKAIMDSLKDETKELQSEKDVKEAKLLEQQGELNEKKSKLQVAESELEIYTSRQSAETKKLETIRKSLKDAADAQEKRAQDIKKVQEYIPQLEQEVAKAKTELKEVVNAETQCEQKRNSLLSKVEEAKSSMAASKSQNRVLESLMAEKKKGSLPGIYGRLGDLGAIDSQYDVAISTACGSLDHIVVDTVDTGKRCIEFLKKHNIGQGKFILLDKMEVWREETKKRITTPENVPRLFDLVRVKDEVVKTCFYFALRNTLVSKDIDQATRIAYGKTRYRVVTLKGELIEVSGAMSGGGNSVCRGKMGSSIVSDVDPKQVTNMENTLEKLNREYESLRLKKFKLEDTIGQKEKDLVQLKHNQAKHSQEVHGLKERLAALKEQEKEQEEVLKSAIPDQSKLKEIESNVASYRKAYDKVAQTATKLEEQVKELHNQIMDIGGAKLSAVQSRLKCINGDIDKVTGQITKNNVGVKTAERNLKRAEEKVATVGEEITETKQQVEVLCQKLKDMEGEATKLLEIYEKAQADVKEREGSMEGMRTEVESLEEEETEMAKNGVDIQHEIEKVEGVLKENRMKIKHWKKEVSGLKLTSVSREDEEESLTLPELSAEELASLGKQEVQYQITVQEERLASMKPNMAAIAEYRKKEETYLQRVGELDNITGVRDQQRQYHESLRKQRLEEFMAGFQVITNKLKEMYQMITLGGDAELELVDSLDPFSEGIVFSVRPPKKSWKNISNLSGGEKTLSSLALVFALHHYKPTPLYVMDEIDAALDFKNVSIVANYIKERTKNAQFIIISLRNNMFELADRLVGIYKTHDCTKSVTLNPWKLSQDFSNKIREVHNIDINADQGGL